MRAQIQLFRLLIFAAILAAVPTFTCRGDEQIPKLNYEAVPDFFQLPAGEHFVEVAGVAVNSKGHIFVFHRGKHPLMEFDANGKYLRSIADDLFVTAHTVRVDGEDNIWTTDVGSHVVLKLSPEGRVLLSLGRMRTPGDDVLHFNQPTDVAFDRDGNIYVADGEGNSRVLKFNKYGNVLLGWGMKGSGPGQFDLPHSIAIDGDLAYVGDRENARIQIFDLNGPLPPRMGTRGSKKMSRFIESPRAPEPVGAFPHAKRVGNLLFLSGIGPRVRGSKEIPGVTLDSAGNVASYDIEKQCRAVFENVRLVLEDAGANWNDIVDVTVFLTNMKKDFPIYNRLYAEHFAGECNPNPTRTTIEVTALPTPIAIELKVVAAVA